MKNKIIIFGLLFSIAFSSCTDWLNPKPLDTMVIEDYWKTKDDVESMVYACYEAMTQEDFMKRIILGGEVRSDNVTKGASNPDDGDGLKELLNVSIQPKNTYAKWEAFYKVINYCNNIIAFAPGVQELDPDYTNGLLKIDLAEAHTIRALVYFYLVRLYKDVPYITRPTIDDTEDFMVEATDGTEILTEELKHLVTSETGAVRTRGNHFVANNTISTIAIRNAVKNKGRINKNSVRAIMADIYLWLENYDACIQACNRILEDELTEDQYNNGDRSLFTGAELYLIPNPNSDTKNVSESYYQIFDEGNSVESIFELQFTSNNLDGLRVMKDIYGNGSNGTKWLYVSKLSEWQLFESSDLRAHDSYIKEGTSDTSPTIILKYIGTITGEKSAMLHGRDVPKNWIFYRLADIYLMKAEALAELGEENFDEAFQLINKIHNRSNPTKQNSLVQPTSISEMRDLFMDERQREFLFEGKRWFDLLRYARREKSTMNVLSKYLIRNYDFNADVIQSKLSDMNSFYMPIHRDELIVNSNLKQNPFYINSLQE